MSRVNTHGYWRYGDHIVVRGVWKGQLWWANAATVVKDEPELMALYWQVGSPVVMSAIRHDPRLLLSSEQIELVMREWVRSDVLMLALPDAAHAVCLMWDAGHAKLWRWYIDLQKPMQRTSIGFDTMDQFLDVVVSPDRSEWQWKDEDEFDEAIEIGVFSEEEAEAIRAEGMRAVELVQAENSPYKDEWRDWRPPDEWKIPTLPDRWDEVGLGDEM